MEKIILDLKSFYLSIYPNWIQYQCRTYYISGEEFNLIFQKSNKSITRQVEITLSLLLWLFYFGFLAVIYFYLSIANL